MLDRMWASASRRWSLVIATFVVAGGVGSIPLRDRWDEWFYTELRLALVPFVLGGVAAAVTVVTWWVRSRIAGTASVARQQAEVEAHAAARDERGRLIRRLDYEIKNPVTAIRAGMANVSAAELPPSATAALASIDEQARRLSRLVGDLRNLAELESEELERSPVDLAEVVNDVSPSRSATCPRRRAVAAGARPRGAVACRRDRRRPRPSYSSPC